MPRVWWTPQDQAGRRAGSNVEFGGTFAYNQHFFVASFPGIYANIWKNMTEGAHALLIACACVFFQDTHGSVNGKHAQDRRGCRCDFCAECALSDQPRPQVGTTFKDWKRNTQAGDWDGIKPPWGCLWMKLWELNM